MQAFFRRMSGVVETQVGYANGKGENPSYQQVCSGETGFAETLYIKYDQEVVCLNILLDYFFYIIDPYSVNRQGEDEGTQYRSGIYYSDSTDEKALALYMEDIRHHFLKPIVTEVLPLANFYPAEEYHQDYLEKNPQGYCHINLSLLRK